MDYQTGPSPVHVRLAPSGADPRQLAHDLLLDLASTLVDRPTLTHDDTGRPHVAGLAVSISYSLHQIAVAASYDGPIGVDIEDVRPRHLGVADRWFTPRELDWMTRQPDRLRAFLHLWTAKEAAGKALGLGLRRSGLRREMPVDGGPIESEPTLAITHLPCADAVLTVAAPARSTVLLRCRTVNDS